VETSISPSFDAFKQFCLKHGVESKYASDYYSFVKAFTKKLVDKGVRLKEGRKERDGKPLKIWWGLMLKKKDDKGNYQNDNLQLSENENENDNSEGNDTDVQDFSVESAGLKKEKYSGFDEFSGPIHSETFKHFDIQQEGCITYYTCKRCGFRVITENDAHAHLEACLRNSKWMEEYEERKREVKRYLLTLLNDDKD